LARLGDCGERAGKYITLRSVIDVLSTLIYVNMQVVFTQIIKDLGVDDVKAQELYDIEEDSLRGIKDAHGIIFLFRWKEEEVDEEIETTCPEGIWFANQVSASPVGGHHTDIKTPRIPTKIPSSFSPSFIGLRLLGHRQCLCIACDAEYLIQFERRAWRENGCIQGVFVSLDPSLEGTCTCEFPLCARYPQLVRQVRSSR